MNKTIAIVGSGVAGLRAAIELLNNGYEVLVFSKDKLSYCNTDKAQGGIAVVLNPLDSLDKHIEDTLKAGAGLCRKEAVEILVKEGPERVRELINWGANFDRNDKGELDFTKEAAHSTNRILHALGDATGHEIEQTLIKKLKTFSRVEIFEYRMLLRILTENNQIYGVEFLNLKTEEYEVYKIDAAILATGGYAAIYKNTTNPQITTGDGIATTFLAGATLEDMEFVQFHPTALKRYNAPQFLLSESMRGEGAVLINDRGEEFMRKYHRLGDLAPRDVVARSIIFEMKERGIDKVYLDATKMGADFVRKRFPTIYNECLKYGLDISKEAIPVSPAAHYTMGGIKTDVKARTSIKGLFAAGEVACNGVHGANRLASNSMLEGLVFGKRAAESATEFLKSYQPINIEVRKPNTINCNKLALKRRIEDLKETIWNKLGVVRRMKEMEEILNCSWALFLKHNLPYNCPEGITLRNMALIASAIAYAGILRKSSVGAHYCVDTPHSYDNKRHISFNIKDLEKNL
ncbi:L-aspartate oxidase [Hippea maritima]|uniref:L-aspartate oxidase n=1 Tax=Hippea maritima (strain ATCC 700847 / DSM 10411 / MH2) TaxID=760142 RepID=F2LUI9_HIPMA|nr:L-aspartate oxidase [Hippea maritima]AEA34579.1 L-aspartate oxidase [Hippea maritima DSM 10411]